MNNFVICMPEYNEGEILFNFIHSIESELGKTNFIIIDDCSPQQFKEKLLEKYGENKDFYLIFNEKNMGHGISTINGLKKALDLNFEYIVAVDGDGQFQPKDINNCIQYLKNNSNIEIVEGVRNSRDEIWFRKIISLFTRFLIFTKTLTWPKDANTPLRVYKKETLTKLLELIPKNSLIPNLHISKLTRRQKINFKEIEVQSFPRGGQKGLNVQSVSWNQKFKKLPSKRLIIFCLKATKEWISS